MSRRPHARASDGGRRSRRSPRAALALIVGLSCALAATWGLLAPSSAKATSGAITATEGAGFSGQVGNMTTSQCVTAPLTAGPSGTINWGDGQSSPAGYSYVAGTAPRQYAVSGSHTYGEEGSYAATVTTTYTCGGSYSSTFSFAAQVADASLNATAANVTATPGHRFSGQVAGFSDADPGGMPADYTATIDWGDGTAASAGSVGALGGGFSVSGAHVYATAGTYALTVTVTDAGGSSAIVHGTATVTESGSPPPPGTTVAASFTPTTSQPGFGKLVGFDGSASRSTGTTVRSYVWEVNGLPAVQCAGVTSVLHTRFVTPGVKTITLTVTDAAGHLTSVAHTITVGGFPPSPRAAKSRRILSAQQVFTCLPGSTDPGNASVAPPVNHAPGAGCTTQVQSAIIDAVGCLTEHYDTISLYYHQNPASALYYTQYIKNYAQPLDSSVPPSEALTYLHDIGQFFNIDTSIQLCPSLPKGSPLWIKLCEKPNPVPASASAVRAPIAQGVLQNVAVDTTCSHTANPTGPDSATACVDLYVSSGPVRINGLDYVPDPGSVILFSPEFNLVIGGHASIWLDNIQLHPSQSINYQLPSDAQGPNADYTALQVDDIRSLTNSQPAAAAPSELGGLGSLGHFPSTGSLLAKFEQQSTYLTYQVQLPPPFSDGNGNPVTATVYAQVSNTQRFQILYAELGGPAQQGVTVHVGPATLKGFSACFRAHPGGSLDPCPYVTGLPEEPSFGENFWDASGELDVGSASLIFRPSATALSEAQQQLKGCPARLRLGIGFSGGSLAFAGAVLNTPNAKIAGSLALTALGATFDNTQPNLATLCGFADFTIGDVATIDGRIFGAFASSGHPYHFTGAELGTTAGGQNVIQPGGTSGTYPLTNDFALGAGGTVSLTLPSFGTRQVGDGYALYTDDPPAVSFGANVDFALPAGTYENLPKTGIAVRGNLYGAIGLGSTSTFDIQGSVGVVARFFNVAECGNLLSGFSCETTVINDNVQAVVSRSAAGDGGIAVCGSITFPFPATGGFGYHWGDNLDQILTGDIHTGGCDFVNQFVVNVPGASGAQARAAALGSTRIHVAPGTSAVDLYLTGQGGAPDVTIHGPGGLSASTKGVKGHARQGPFLLAPVTPLDKTYVTILNPRPGSYTIAPNPGSARITQIRQADGVTPAVAVRVIGRGAKRRIAYQIKREPGQKVIFMERSTQVNRELGSAAGGRGSIAFIAAPGRQQRQIIAEIFEHGAPQTSLTVASYAPPGQTRLGRVRQVSVRRAGANATITFTNVPGARRYAVYVKLSDGARISYVTTRREITYRGLFPEVAGLVTVRALGDNVYTLTGGPRTERLSSAIELQRLRAHPKPARHRRHKR